MRDASLAGLLRATAEEVQDGGALINDRRTP